MKTKMCLEAFEEALFRRGFTYDPHLQKWTRRGLPKNVLVSQKHAEEMSSVDRVILLNKIDQLVKENP